MKRTKKGDLNLPRCLTVEKAAGLHKDFLAASSDGGDLVFVGDKVEAVDVAGLQLLLATRASARASGKPFEIYRPSQALTEAVRLTGLVDLLEQTGQEGSR
ncbi:MAG: STAS domain-containing protein [Nitrospirota bacterium]|jgi:anti-anti-sigma regulatory factor